jgi:hypothetical protein
LRFLVMPRYGADLQTVLDASGNVLSKLTASSIAIQVVGKRCATVSYLVTGVRRKGVVHGRTHFCPAVKTFVEL